MTIRASIVVPTFKRPGLLSRCLGALIIQEFDPSAYEIIIADDAASEETRDLVQRWSERALPSIKYVPVFGNTGPAAARNAGWQAAQGDIIAFTDDDCLPEPDWLSSGVASLDEGADGSWGRIIVPVPRIPTDYERDAAQLQQTEFVTANCFCRRETLVDVNGFDERFKTAWREDSDLFFTLLKNNHQIVHTPHSVVYHPVRPGSWGISLRQQKKSMFNALLYKKHPHFYRRKIQAAPPWNYYASVGILLVAIAALSCGLLWFSATAGFAWAALTARFCLQRLRQTSHAPGHIFEMLVTSAVIPFLSVFWRLCGALRFRVFFL